MGPLAGWSLALLALAVGWWQYRGPGLLLALGVIVFWLLLQFSRALRAMQRAGQAPVGRIDSAVMLGARLRTGMSLVQVIGLTRSLGRRLGAEGEQPERWMWTDDGGASVTLYLTQGKLQRWELARPPE